MGNEGKTNTARQVWWGVALILVGVAFLLERQGVLEMPALWNLWPLVFFVIGGAKLFTPSRPKDIAEGLVTILMGVWFFANLEGWWGFHWGNSWPVVLVLIGASVLLETVLERAGRPKEGGHV